MNDSPFAPQIGTLLKRHFEHLMAGSGISLEVIKERGYRSILGKGELRRLGFSAAQCRTPGLLLPVCPPDGSGSLCSYRPDDPRMNAQGKPLKYELPAGSGIRLDVPPRCRPMLADPTIALWFTEGQKKADALATHGLCAAALLGVWNFKGKNPFGAVTLLADFDLIGWNGRTINIVFDSDVMVKPQVRQALDRLSEHIQRKGASINAVYLPGGTSGKVGVDDYLLAHTVADLEALVEAPRTTPRPAPPVVELLEAPPPSLTRPLQLVDGRAYAAAWPWTKVTIRQESDKKTGKIILLEPPVVRNERRLFIIREDGVVFGEGGDQTLEELGFQVTIPTTPRDAKLWSALGIKRYRAGQRADPRAVFARLVNLLDKFMAFDRSLGDQRSMCEMVTCYILSTWSLDGFDVIGFMWFNGGYGCGKTKLGVLVCEVAYLGEVLLSGSTYACLRDLADLGATLLFDDAEALADPRKSDPDKRNLLLAGNRKGTVVALKEQDAKGNWHTRYVNTYCPRLLTAIRLPDAVLASRTLVVPLVRTADPCKANSEPLDYAQWPCDRQMLLDDLWAVSLANLAQMPKHLAAVNQDAPLMGRNLEPWKGLLSVAHWLDSLGEAGLYRRMCDLAQGYQTERVELEVPDLTRLVVRALVELFREPDAPSAPYVPFAPSGREALFEIAVSTITTKVNELAVDEDLVEEGDSDYANSKRVGKILTTLRLKKAPKASGRSRARLVSFHQIDQIARSYGLKPLFPIESETGQTGHLGQTGQDPQADGIEEELIPVGEVEE